MRTTVSVFMGRTIRAIRVAAGDRRIPRPLRWFAALALLPVPGPFDEVVLLLVAMPLFAFYRRELRDAWQLAGASREAGEHSRSPASAVAGGGS